MNNVVVGLDIGYSNVGVVSGPPGRPQAYCMPAGAGSIKLLPKALRGTLDTGYTVTTAQGDTWVAGVEPDRLQGWSRDLHDDYPSSDTYRALFHAALLRAGHRSVAHLITGLPVTQYLDTDRREKLAHSLTGVHRVADGFDVTIENVSVLPQPAGGYMDYATSTTDVELAEDGRILIIDPGFYSVDWVAIQGGEIRHTASGSSVKAMSMLLAAADDLLFEQYGQRYGMHRIEQTIREGRENIFIGGKKIALHPVIAHAAADTTSSALRELRQSLRGDMSGFDLLLLVGGGAGYYEDAARAVFPGTRVQKIDDPVNANARGFWTLGT
ncbi:ParM/StbA family protein [Salinisphaera sp. T31B1]|uniref:ParM/StbA family protein n=1 Tax=Salinisphaera sp. T31B1 TaxID=727963 RepID=UPI00334286B6